MYKAYIETQNTDGNYYLGGNLNFLSRTYNTVIGLVENGLPQDGKIYRISIYRAENIHTDPLDVFEYRYIGENGTYSFNVSLHGKHVDEVLFAVTKGTTKSEMELEVYRSLVDHDGYDPSINVRRIPQRRYSIW